MTAAYLGGLGLVWISAALGGGGHRFAAGFTSDKDVPGTVALLRDALAAWERRTLA
jgi:nanoRNase/pAp phosphatase (c-di-AMP/oligoRNAs hydrolase)